MFVRKGQVLGSVLHRAVPKTETAPEREEDEQQPAPEAVEPEPEPETEPGEVVRPKDYAPKPEWVRYAVAVTADTDNPLSEWDADDLTKTELIERYGGHDNGDDN